MFRGCSLLSKLNISIFNAENVTNMWEMFSRCYSLKELNLDNFNTNNVIVISNIFFGYPNELIKKIRLKYKIIIKQAFE